MLLERTITQLDIGDTTPEQAQKLGHLGYLQWLGALPGASNYRHEAARARALASPLSATSPAVAVFCDLLAASTGSGVAPLPLKMPERHRRGGSRARRGAL
ncbi:MAG: hypothetical protein AAGC81_20335 [Pseudomonadota bacterium]